MLRLKRAYEGKQADDGIRILVDKLWPRGLRSTEAGIDEWAKDLAPRDELRQWFAHRTERWLGFRQRYSEELLTPQKEPSLKRIARMAVSGDVTLVYAARDTEHNNARVLAELVTRFMNDLPQE